jgi:hypothetical protein
LGDWAEPALPLYVAHVLRKLDQLAPLLFVALGLVMILAAAVAGFSEGLAISFVVLGVGLVALGGFASKLKPGEPFEIGLSGLKAVLTDAKQIAEEENRPAEAKVVGDLAKALDEAWFEDYLRQSRWADKPYDRARALQQAWRNRLRQRQDDG